jgi:peptide/nickel transport system permease protein
LVQASVVVIAILVILINLITDIIYAKLDPRIRLS